MSGEAQATRERAARDVLDAKTLVRQLKFKTSKRFDPMTCWRRIEAIQAGMPDASDHVTMHESLMDYRSEVKTYADELGSLWDDAFTRMVLDDEVVELSLADMGEYQHLRQTRSETDRDGAKGLVTYDVEYRFLFPLSVVRDAYEQLNKCALRIGLLPQAKEHFEDGHLEDGNFA